MQAKNTQVQQIVKINLHIRDQDFIDLVWNFGLSLKKGIAWKTAYYDFSEEVQKYYNYISLQEIPERQLIQVVYFSQDIVGAMFLDTRRQRMCPDGQRPNEHQSFIIHVPSGRIESLFPAYPFEYEHKLNWQRFVDDNEFTQAGSFIKNQGYIRVHKKIVGIVFTASWQEATNDKPGQWLLSLATRIDAGSYSFGSNPKTTLMEMFLRVLPMIKEAFEDQIKVPIEDAILLCHLQSPLYHPFVVDSRFKILRFHTKKPMLFDKNFGKFDQLQGNPNHIECLNLVINPAAQYDEYFKTAKNCAGIKGKYIQKYVAPFVSNEGVIEHFRSQGEVIEAIRIEHYTTVYSADNSIPDRFEFASEIQTDIGRMLYHYALAQHKQRKIREIKDKQSEKCKELRSYIEQSLYGKTLANLGMDTVKGKLTYSQFFEAIRFGQDVCNNLYHKFLISGLNRESISKNIKAERFEVLGKFVNELNPSESVLMSTQYFTFKDELYALSLTPRDRWEYILEIYERQQRDENTKINYARIFPSPVQPSMQAEAPEESQITTSSKEQLSSEDVKRIIVDISDNFATVCEIRRRQLAEQDEEIKSDNQRQKFINQQNEDKHRLEIYTTLNQELCNRLDGSAIDCLNVTLNEILQFVKDGQIQTYQQIRRISRDYAVIKLSELMGVPQPESDSNTPGNDTD